MNAEAKVGRLPADAGTGPLGLRPEPVPVSAIRQVSTVASNDFWARKARQAAAIRDVQDRFYQQWLKLSADMAAEIARIEREGV